MILGKALSKGLHVPCQKVLSLRLQPLVKSGTGGKHLPKVVMYTYRSLAKRDQQQQARFAKNFFVQKPAQRQDCCTVVFGSQKKMGWAWDGVTWDGIRGLYGYVKLSRYKVYIQKYFQTYI